MLQVTLLALPKEMDSDESGRATSNAGTEGGDRGGMYRAQVSAEARALSCSRMTARG